MRNLSQPKAEAAQEGRTVTLVGALINLFLIIIKFLAGIFGHSQALVADAVHSLSDLFTDAIVLVSVMPVWRPWPPPLWGWPWWPRPSIWA